MPYLSVFLVADAPGPSQFSLIFWSCFCNYNSLWSVPSHVLTLGPKASNTGFDGKRALGEQLLGS